MNKWFDRLATSFGYIKSAAVALTTSAAMGFREYPNAKSADMLGSYVSWVFACVKARSRDVARIELKLYKVTNRKTGEVEEVMEHDVLSLLRSVNPFTSFQQLIESTQAYKDLTGEAFWYLVRAGSGGNGMITQIWLLRPDYMSIKTSKDGFISSYEYIVPGQQPITFQLNEIIHHKEFNPINPYRGMGVVRAAAVTIDAESYAEEYNKKFFRNSAVPEIVLKTEQKLSDAQVKRMHAEWGAKYGGTNNAHKTAILEGGLGIESFSISQKDMEFLAGLGFSRDKILALFEVPKSRLGMTEGVSVSNADATINIYLKYLVKPLMEGLRDALNEFLLPLYKGTEDMFFEIEDPVPQDVNAEMTRLESEFRMGAITPNEVREEGGRDQVPGLDSFYLAIGQQPIAGEAKDAADAEAAAAAEAAQQQPVVPVTGEDGKPVKAKAQRRKKRVRIPSMRLRERVGKRIAAEITEEIKGAVISSVGAHMPVFTKDVKDALPANTWSYELKQAFWKQLVGKAENFEKHYKNKLVGLFEAQEKQVLDQLATVEGKSAMMKFTRSEIESILISVAAENKVAADVLIPLVRQIIEESGNDTLDFIGIEDRAFDAQTEAVRSFLRDDALKGIRVMNKVTKSKLRKSLATALQDGLGPVETARKIRDVFDEAKTVRALRVARTETLKAANHGALEAYKQSGVVIGKQWLTSEDELTCQWCAPLNGKIQAVDQEFFHKGESLVGQEGGIIKFNLDSIPAAPLHPNCRCTIVPVTVNQNNAGEGTIHKTSESAE
jgi:HK97 family phage portal protein